MTDLLDSKLFRPTCLWDLKATLGEGPIWSAKDHAVWFVDIKKQHVHRYDVRTGGHQTFNAPSPCGFIAPKQRGGFIVGCKTGLYDFEPQKNNMAGSFTFLTHIEPGLPTNRLNDGYVDHHGRLWFGSMDDDEEQATGHYYRYDARGLKRADGPVIITNGPAVSPDGRKIYLNDTLRQMTYVHDLDDNGDISREGTVFAQWQRGDGYPDGPVVDSAGNVWIALFAGGRVDCYAPDGDLIREVKFPVSNITKIAFGGPDLKTVYATTAAKGLSADDIAAQPLAGGLFTFQSDIAGQPQNEIAHV